MSPQEAADYLIMLLWEWPNYDEKRHEAFRLAITALEREAKAEPVAWRVRDYGDGWIYTLKDPQRYHKETGAVVQPLYASPPQDMRDAEIERLKSALLHIECMTHADADELREIARQALGDTHD